MVSWRLKSKASKKSSLWYRGGECSEENKVTSDITLTLLGTGSSLGVPVVGCDCEVCRSADPRDKRLRTSALLSVGGVNIVIDAGPDFRYQMLRAGVRRIDAVLLTHEHKDHTGGVDDLRTFNYLQGAPIQLYALPRVAESVRHDYHYAFAPRNVRYSGVPDVEVNEVEVGEVFTVSGVEVEALGVMHGRLPILGYRIGGVCYITDVSEFSEPLLQRLRGCDVLVLSALRRKEHVSHLSLAQALRVVEAVAPDRAIFTHCSHNIGLYDEVQGELPAGVELGYDGMRVVVE